MFPPANAQVYRNEAGEPIGWDIPSDDDYFEEHLDDRDWLDEPECECGIPGHYDDECPNQDDERAPISDP